MAKKLKKLGLLTSGGDCAGLNAAIRAVVRRATLGHDMTVYGIADGTEGLQRRPIEAPELTLETVSGGMGRTGGTILGANSRGDPLDDKALFTAVIDGYQQLGLDALITIGGDGSMHIYNELTKMAAAKGVALNIVGIPKTMDNDLGLTENAIGYDTAVAVATEALDRLQPTAASHDRVMILEVMGRDAGHVALAAGIAGQADIILIPEIPYSIEAIVKHIDALRAGGQNHALIIVSEAVKTMSGDKAIKELAHGAQRYGGIGAYLMQQLGERMKADIRVTSLGHTVRGAAPGHLDRTIAAAFGVAAVDLAAVGKFGHMVAWQNRKVVAVPIVDAVATYQAVDPTCTLVQTARGLGVSFGD